MGNCAKLLFDAAWISIVSSRRKEFAEVRRLRRKPDTTGGAYHQCDNNSSSNDSHCWRFIRTSVTDSQMYV
ncbi:MAG TPA: hypothetical protein VFE46_07960 [Pirellulales bacterium]|nr:hypothetical protein [Pirellulales bacterium]